MIWAITKGALTIALNSIMLGIALFIIGLVIYVLIILYNEGKELYEGYKRGNENENEYE